MDLMTLLKDRRTYRRFEQKAISEDILQDILTVARSASSAANKQSLTYVVVQSPEKVKEVFKLTKWAGYLPAELGQPKADEAPVLFIGIIENENSSAICDTDAGLAISNMTLAAWNHGVGSCIIGAFDKVKLSQMFDLSENQKLHTVVAVGYPTHTSTIVDVKDGDIKYYQDENKNYIVPKRTIQDVVKYH